MAIGKRLQRLRRNRQYIRNDKIIQKVILKLLKNHQGHITTIQVVKAAKLTKRTVYTHYPKLYRAPYEIENKLVSDFKAELKERSVSLSKIIPENNERVFYIVFLYMAHDSDIFTQVCINTANHNTLYRIARIVYPQLDIIWYPVNAPVPEIGSERADMYISMCVEILARWGCKTKCNIQKSRRYINRLLRLTSDASSRCK